MQHSNSGKHNFVPGLDVHLSIISALQTSKCCTRVTTACSFEFRTLAPIFQNHTFRSRGCTWVSMDHQLHCLHSFISCCLSGCLSSRYLRFPIEWSCSVAWLGCRQLFICFLQDWPHSLITPLHSQNLLGGRKEYSEALSSKQDDSTQGCTVPLGQIWCLQWGLFQQS